jgi:hypothetical protein
MLKPVLTMLQLRDSGQLLQIVEGRKEVDWTRNAAFTIFGFAYLGGFQYWLYNVKFTQLCAPLTARVGHKGVAPIKTLLDQGLQ